MPVLSDEAVARTTRWFAEAADGSGAVTGAQVAGRLAALLGEEGSAPGGAGGEFGTGCRVQARVDAMDTARDGVLTLPELLFLLGYMKVSLICQVLFLAADKNGSGALEPSEIKPIILAMKEQHGLEPPSDAEMDDIIEAKLQGRPCSYHTFAKFAVPRILNAMGVDVTCVDAEEKAAAGPATPTITKENYAVAESQVIFKDYCAKIAKATGSETGTNVFLHVPRAHDPNDRTVMRPNFDTMYSFAVVDLTEEGQAATLVMPAGDAGRYQSALVVSEEHWLPLIAEKPGSYVLTAESVGTPWCMIIMRTQVNMNDPEDRKAAHDMQLALELRMSKPGAGHAYAPAEWDMEEILSMRAYYESYTHDHADITSANMFGRRGRWPLLNHNCGTAFGWGGFPAEQAVYPQIPVADASGKGRFKITLRDVPVDAFWSVTVYDAEGYVSTAEGAVYNINAAFAATDGDGACTVRFGDGYADGVPNVMTIMEGWNVTLRLYQPRPAYFDGSWQLPVLERDE